MSTARRLAGLLALVALVAACSPAPASTKAPQATRAAATENATETASPAATDTPAEVATDTPSEEPTPEATETPTEQAAASLPVAPAGYGWVDESESGFRILVPAGWLTFSASDLSGMESAFQALSDKNPTYAKSMNAMINLIKAGQMPVMALDQNAHDLAYVPNVNVIVEPRQNDALATGIATLMAKQLESQFGLASGTVKTKPATVHGLTAVEFDYAASMVSYTGSKATFKARQLLVFGATHSYIVTAGALATEFPSYARAFDAILGSFTEE